MQCEVQHVYSVDVEQSAYPWKDTCDRYVYIGYMYKLYIYINKL